VNTNNMHLEFISETMVNSPSTATVDMSGDLVSVFEMLFEFAKIPDGARVIFYIDATNGSIDFGEMNEDSSFKDKSFSIRFEKLWNQGLEGDGAFGFDYDAEAVIKMAVSKLKSKYKSSAFTYYYMTEMDSVPKQIDTVANLKRAANFVGTTAKMIVVVLYRRIFKKSKSA